MEMPKRQTIACGAVTFSMREMARGLEINCVLCCLVLDRQDCLPRTIINLEMRAGGKSSCRWIMMARL